jgi:glycosyltransferase involved in cell wall biosynthesis
VFPPSKRAVARTLLRGKGFAALAMYIASLSLRGRRRARALGYAVCAADLATHSRKLGLDHIHVHSCADTAHVAAMAFLLGGAPYSLHLHGDLDVYGTDHKQKMKHARFVSAAARPMQQQLIDVVGLPPSRTHTMIMGVDTRELHARPAAPRKGPLHLVSVSRLALCKGHKYTLTAMRRAVDAGADLRYTIAGSGPDKALIEADIQREGLSDRVTMVGPLSGGAIGALLQTADAFVLTSFGQGEASPVAVMEAMASGVPTICSRIGGTGDMITDDVDGLLVGQENVDDIVRAMQRLSSDDALRLRLGAAARARAEKQFDARVLAARMLATISAASG